MERKTDYRFKILYCLAIIMVVLGHCQGGSIHILDNWFPLSGLHIMLFVFASGYFYRTDSVDHVGKYILKKVRKLLVPLFFYNLFYGWFASFMYNRGFYFGGKLTFETLFIIPIKYGNQFLYNLGSWFIIPMFMCEVYNVVLRYVLRKIRIPEAAYYVFNTILGILGIELAILGYNEGWYLVLIRFLYFLPFYAFGTFYRQKLEMYDLKIPNIIYFSIIFASKIIISFFLLKIPSYTPSWCNDFVDGPIMPILNGLLGILFWFRICHILEPAIGRSKYINIVSDHTYSIMMNQFLGIFLIKAIYSMINVYTPFFSDFNQELYHHEFFYCYLPHGQEFMLLIYVVAGIVIPILIDYAIAFIRNRIKTAS